VEMRQSAAAGMRRSAIAGVRRHDASQSTRRCKVAGEHASILVHGVVTIGRLIGDNSAGVFTRAEQRRGIGGKRELIGVPCLSMVAAW
jgi:hypothetical protein